MTVDLSCCTDISFVNIKGFLVICSETNLVYIMGLQLLNGSLRVVWQCFGLVDGCHSYPPGQYSSKGSPKILWVFCNQGNVQQQKYLNNSKGEN